jgi:hypothetical protein
LIKGEIVVFLLCGGDKSTQERDVKKSAKDHDCIGVMNHEGNNNKVGFQRISGQPGNDPRAFEGGI